MTLARLPVDTAFVAMLRDNLSQQVYFADSGPTTESGVPPAGAQVPYAVVYTVPGGEFYGPPLTDPEDAGEFLYQITCVGGTAAQAVTFDDKVRDLVVGRTTTGAFTTALSVSGMVVAERKSTDGTSGATATGKLWQTTPRFAVSVTPA